MYNLFQREGTFFLVHPLTNTRSNCYDSLEELKANLHINSKTKSLFSQDAIDFMKSKDKLVDTLSYEKLTAIPDEILVYWTNEKSFVAFNIKNKTHSYLATTPFEAINTVHASSKAYKSVTETSITLEAWLKKHGLVLITTDFKTYLKDHPEWIL